MTTPSELDEAALAEVEALGRIARDAMIAHAKAQGSPQAAWMAPWEEMLDSGRALYRAAARAVADQVRAAAERDAREWQRSNALAMDDLRACTAELSDAQQRIAELEGERDALMERLRYGLCAICNRPLERATPAAREGER